MNTATKTIPAALVVTLAKSTTDKMGVTRWSVWANDHRLYTDTSPTSLFEYDSMLAAPTNDDKLRDALKEVAITLNMMSREVLPALRMLLDEPLTREDWTLADKGIHVTIDALRTMADQLEKLT